MYFSFLRHLVGSALFVMAVTPVGAIDMTPTNGSGGLPVGLHDTEIAGQAAIVLVGEGYDPATPTLLCYYLHGDEGGYNFHMGSNSPVRQLIDEMGWIYVAPQAPQAPERPEIYPWDGRSGGSQTGNVTLVEDVLEHMFEKYNVYRDVIFGAGASGGSWFHDAVFFPRRGAEYPSFFNLNCGAAGQRPGYFTYNSALAVSQVPSAVERSELKYTIGTGDFLYNNATVSAPTYTDLGFSVVTEFKEGVGHCAFDVAAEMEEYWRGKWIELAAQPPAGGGIAVTEIRIAPGSGNVTLSWASEPGVLYRIERVGDLQTGGWEVIETVAGAGAPAAESSHTDDGAVAAQGGRAFYRVVRQGG